MLRSIVTLGLVLLGLTAPWTRAQGIPVGQVVTPDDCTPIEGGELYAQHLDGAYDDWMSEASAKAGPLVGFWGGDRSGGAYQVNAWNFTRDVTMDETMVIYVTFPEGGLYIESDWPTSAMFLGLSQVQQVGDTPPASLSSTEPSVACVLPDDLGSWEAGLDSGPAAFPRLTEGWPEVAFAPVRELDILNDTATCTTGGLSDDSLGGGGLLAGYSVYRLESLERPELEELASQENWLDYFSYPPTADSQAQLHDPDGWWSTGDEVLVYLDGELARDGSDRLHGSPPRLEAGRRYWYAVQPVARGDVQDFANVGLAGAPALDHRDDLDGDGIHDAVDFGGAGSPDGPEFVSPQAEAGEWGLGLTTEGRALLSKRMAVDMSELGVGTADTDDPDPEDPGPVTEPLQLRIFGDLLVWGGGPAGQTLWRVSRSRTPEALATGAPVGAASRHTKATRTHRDPQRPGGDGWLFYYRVEPVR